MNYPKLYVFDGFPVKGELGDNTRLEVREICEVCHRKDFIYHHLSYKFDEWDGEDVIKGVDFYLISEKLKKIFTEENIKGIGFQEIENEKSEFFKFSRNSYQKELPVFYKIDIYAQLDGPEIWFERAEICEKCGDQKWEDTIEGISSLVTSDSSEDYTPREVYKSSWNGEAVFLLKDPGPPILTEGLLELIKVNTNQVLELREARWA